MLEFYSEIACDFSDCARAFPGTAHQPNPPRSIVIMNTSCGGEPERPHLPPLPTGGGGREILAPHEMKEYVRPEV